MKHFYVKRLLFLLTGGYAHIDFADLKCILYKTATVRHSPEADWPSQKLVDVYAKSESIDSGRGARLRSFDFVSQLHR